MGSESFSFFFVNYRMNLCGSIKSKLTCSKAYQEGVNLLQ